jgi:metal-dependent amidase/aminoacylase/carboxypeptidase family protein
MDKHIQFDIIDNIDGWLREVRRDLHRYPGWAEKSSERLRRSRRISTSLELNMNPAEAAPGRRVHQGRFPGKTVAIRADMDALPILRRTMLSIHPKTQGLCTPAARRAYGDSARDGEILRKRKRPAARKHQADFPAGRRGNGGAKSMIEAGCLGPKVDSIIGLHVEPTLPCGWLK